MQGKSISLKYHDQVKKKEKDQINNLRISGFLKIVKTNMTSRQINDFCIQKFYARYELFKYRYNTPNAMSTPRRFSRFILPMRRRQIKLI